MSELVKKDAPVRLLGRVVQDRRPGVIAVPGSRPSRFIFSVSLVPNVEKNCLVSFLPNPPEPGRGKRGIATDVRVCLSAVDAPAPTPAPTSPPTLPRKEIRRHNTAKKKPHKVADKAGRSQ